LLIRTDKFALRRRILEPQGRKADGRAGESVPVSVDVRNTGSRDADEVTQLYIHQRYGSSARPIRQLKDFQSVTLKPGNARSRSNAVLKSCA
jgi:hypothetical protein